MTVFSPKQFFLELQRRRVFSTVIVYIVGAWVVVQAADVAFPGFNVPEQAIAYVWLGALLLLPLVVVLGWKYDIYITGIQRTPDLSADADFSTSLQRPDRWLIGGMGAAALVVAGVMLLLISRVEPGDFEEITPNSVAVIPFQWCPGSAEDIALLGGVHAAVINRLATRDRLRVIGRLSAHNMAAAGLSSERMSKLLRVQYLLHGELCRDGVDLVLQAELTDRDQAVVWSGTFRQVVVRDDQVEQELATLVANGVALELGEVSVVDTRGQINVRALELLLIAQYHGRNEHWDEAIVSLNKALEYEPEYTEALYELARAKANSGQITGDSPDSYMRFAETGWPLGEKALALAREEIAFNTADFKTYAVAARILGFMSWWHEEWTWRMSTKLGDAELAARRAVEIEMLQEAEEYARHAISLNPSDSSLSTGLALILARQGPEKRHETLDVLERARQTEPFDEEIIKHLAISLALRGQYERAMEELERFAVLGDISNNIRAEQLEIQVDYGQQDDRLELLVHMLQFETDKYARVENALGHLFWVSSDMPYYGLYEEAESLHQKLETIPERADASSWGKWARQFFLMDKYRQATGSGKSEEVIEEKLAEVEGLSNEEIIDRWFLRVGRYARAFWEVGERDRAIELAEALRYHRISPRWPQRAMQSRLFLISMYLAEGREADAAPVLEEVVDLLERELESGVRHPMVLFNLATAYAGQGHHDEALEMLSMAVDYGCDYMGVATGYVEKESDKDESDWGVWGKLKGDDRFESLVRRQSAMKDQMAANILSLLATHDMDQLLAPVIEMHAASYQEEQIQP